MILLQLLHCLTSTLEFWRGLAQIFFRTPTSLHSPQGAFFFLPANGVYAVTNRRSFLWGLKQPGLFSELFPPVPPSRHSFSFLMGNSFPPSFFEIDLLLVPNPQVSLNRPPWTGSIPPFHPRRADSSSFSVFVSHVAPPSVFLRCWQPRTGDFTMPCLYGVSFSYPSIKLVYRC